MRSEGDSESDPQRLSTLAGATRDDEPLRVAGIDPYGLDLGVGGRLKRLSFRHRLDRPEDLEAYLRGIP